MKVKSKLTQGNITSCSKV